MSCEALHSAVGEVLQSAASEVLRSVVCGAVVCDKGIVRSRFSEVQWSAASKVLWSAASDLAVSESTVCV